MKNKAYLIIVVVSLILTFAILPLNAWGLFEHPTLSVGVFLRGIVFWALTVYFLTRYQHVVKSYKAVLLILVAGLLPDIIARGIMGHFREALTSLPQPILLIIAVLLGWWYTRLATRGKIAVAIVNLLFCIGVSSYGFELWNKLDFVKNSHFDNLEIVDILKQAEQPLLPDSIMSHLQNKNVIVYVGGEEEERNKIGISFLQKVQDEFKENQNVAVLSLICVEKSEKAFPKTSLVDVAYPVVYIGRDHTPFGKSDLYRWYVVDKNSQIKCRDKIKHLEEKDKDYESRQLQFFKEFIEGLETGKRAEK